MYQEQEDIFRIANNAEISRRQLYFDAMLAYRIEYRSASGDDSSGFSSRDLWCRRMIGFSWKLYSIF